MASNVHVVGIQNAKRAIARLAAQSPAMANAAIRAGAAVLGDGMARRAPDLSDEMAGTLAESVQTKPAGPLSVLVGTSHGLAEIAEDGGEITPTKASVLASSATVFGPRVTMPAQPFVRPAVDEDRGKAAAAVKRSAKRQLQKRR